MRAPGASTLRVARLSNLVPLHGAGPVLARPSPPGDGPFTEVIPMIASTSSIPTSSISDPLHAGFLRILPPIQVHAAISFRDIRCPSLRADRIAETIELAWKWYRRLAEKGKD